MLLGEGLLLGLKGVMLKAFFTLDLWMDLPVSVPDLSHPRVARVMCSLLEPAPSPSD